MRIRNSWLLGAVLINCISSPHNAQETLVRTQPWGGQNWSVASTSREIKKERPEIPNEVLAWDSKVIDRVQPSIETQFKRAGFTTYDARQASLVAWKEVRLNSELQPTKRMNRDSFVEFVMSLGKVMFMSKPDKATVHVNGNSNALGDTEFPYWFPGGTIKVLFEKKGFKSVEKDCDVKAPGYNECRAELQPDQQ